MEIKEWGHWTRSSWNKHQHLGDREQFCPANPATKGTCPEGFTCQALFQKFWHIHHLPFQQSYSHPYFTDLGSESTWRVSDRFRIWNHTVWPTWPRSYTIRKSLKLHEECGFITIGLFLKNNGQGIILIFSFRRAWGNKWCSLETTMSINIQFLQNLNRKGDIKWQWMRISCYFFSMSPVPECDYILSLSFIFLAE